MSKDTRCPKCTAMMKEGYLLEIGDGNTLSAAMWVAGAPEKSLLFGTKLKDKEKHPIQSYRCEECGFLESYALSTPPSAA